MKAARGAVVLLSKMSVSKCLVFLKSKVFGNRGCQSVHNECLSPGWLRNRWQVQFPDGCLRGSMCLGWFKGKSPPKEKNVNIKPPTYWDTTRMEKVPSVPKMFSFLAYWSFKCFQSLMQLFTMVWGSLYCKWMQKRKYSWSSICSTVHIFPCTPILGAVLDGRYELNLEGRYRESQS